ncbi:hypothetical protein CMUS01_15466 [Colletotrichum musicola]|uniref:Mid2 domain-containing protein n=1 Tax=Colletotrichum musicola TaxID=2175873 RepID=A0A8H6MMA5_9PEZI|nr:hypothetical protein CMUS01_15466 [Colletotrichum musicola]
MSRSTGLILISLCLLVLFTTFCDGAKCYGYSGFEAEGEQQVCPGSDACCGMNDTCLPNRLCKSENNRDNVLVRGPCLSTPWDRSDCAQICVFNETTGNTGFRDYVFPRVEVCGNNAYCCRQGTASCCDSESIPKVYLDDNGTLLAAAPSPTTSSSTSVASSTETTSSTTTTTAESSSQLETTFATTTSSSSASSEALALKVGLGVGIPLAAIVAGLATWIVLKRRRDKNNASELPAAPVYAYHDGYAGSSTYRSPSPAGRNMMHEMPAKPAAWDGIPGELPGSDVRDGKYR